MSCIFSGYSSKGVAKLKSYSLARASRIALEKLPSFVQDCHPVTTMAPSRILRDLSGIIRSISNSILYPSPRQSGQAPKGLLKEKLLGSISSTLIPQSGQEKLWLKLWIFPSIVSTIRSPSARSRTVSTESESLFSIPGFTIRRSTTISILCLIFLSRLISSESSYRFPSICTRTYPLLFACSRSFA